MSTDASYCPTATTRAPRTILVVEDDYFVAMAIEHALEAAGFAILGPEHSGEAALEIAAKTRPDLAIVDIRLKGAMSGIDAAKALSVNGIRSIFASAHSDDRMKAEGAAARPVGWLAKPFFDEELVTLVRDAVGMAAN